MRGNSRSFWMSSRRRPLVLPLALALALSAAGCTDEPTGGADRTGVEGSEQPTGDGSPERPDPRSAQLNEASEPVTVVGGDSAAATSVEVSEALFATAPAVVVALAGDRAQVSDGAAQAEQHGLPLLLVDQQEQADAGDAAAATSDASADPTTATAAPQDVQAQQAEIERLGAEHVLAMGPEVSSALAELPQASVLTDAAELPDVPPAPGLAQLTVLVGGNDSDEQPAAAAATASATAAGAQVVPVSGPDLRADPVAITALSEQQPSSVLAVGQELGPAETLTQRVEVATSSPQLPGGGQVLFPGRRLVALYGHPGTPGLGVLGEQDVDASVRRATELAEQYASLSDQPVVPTFEIIATVAHSEPGPDGDYSGEIGVEELRPWVEQAGEDGVYVVLDLQPGRASFLEQAKIYEDLLREPHVGLALDPEWRLGPDQQPLGQIGGVDAAEVNSLIDWLGELTTREKLPQKLLVLHQFQLSMLRDEQDLDVGGEQVQVLIHMDGQGATQLKDATWQAVTGAAPDDVPFGWKNFYDEDSPMLTPEQTMTREPTPLMISYQ